LDVKRFVKITQATSTSKGGNFLVTMRQVVRGTNTFHSVTLRSVLAKNRRLAGGENTDSDSTDTGEGGEEVEDTTLVSMGEIGGSNGEYEEESISMMDFDQKNSNEKWNSITPVLLERIMMWTILVVIILVILWAIL
jgi:hypothetical protein